MFSYKLNVFVWCDVIYKTLHMFGKFSRIAIFLFLVLYGFWFFSWCVALDFDCDGWWMQVVYVWYHGGYARITVTHRDFTEATL
jgi:hypothetical protein